MKKIKNLLYLVLIFFIFNNYVIADDSLVILTTFAQTGSSSKTILIMKDRLEKELKQIVNKWHKSQRLTKRGKIQFKEK